MSSEGPRRNLNIENDAKLQKDNLKVNKLLKASLKLKWEKVRVEKKREGEPTVKWFLDVV